MNEPHTTPPVTDTVATTLFAIAQNILVAVLGLLPILFFSASFSVNANKTLILTIGVFLALLFFSLATLRTGRIALVTPWALWGMWGIVAAALLSAIVSGDTADALFGNVSAPQSTVYLGLLALVTTLTSLLFTSKTVVMRLYTVLMVSTGLLSVFHLARLFFGPELLSFGLFTSTVASPVGGWNDVALFYGFVVLIAMVAIEQLPLTKLGQLLTGGVVVVALIMLAIINFYALWLVLGLAGLVVLVYALTKDRFQPAKLIPDVGPPPLASVIVSALVFTVSILFVIGGSLLGSTISNLTNISYVEVRPSFEATVDVTRAVYHDNAVTGIGTNRFADAWRQHKDRAINETVFWNTDFPAGNGYITTQFATMGVIGGVAWIVFLAALLYTGWRMLTSAPQGDRFWYFIGTSSFISSVYLWFTFVIYVPGAAMLALAAMSTGVMFAAYAQLLPQYKREYGVAMNRQGGFVLIAATMVVMIVSVGALYTIGRQFYAYHIYTTAVNSIVPGQNLTAVEQSIASAFTLVENDLFAGQLATYQLARLNTLLALSEPTEEQQQQFQNAIANGINSAERAIALDPTEARYHAILGSIYSVLATANIDGATERAQSSLSEARRFDPQNPEYALLEAQLLSRTGDVAAAREKVTEATRLKRNYTDAYYFLSQLDIATGNTASAVEATRATIALEPNNPARQYQLGVLLASQQNTAGAIAAFERAVAIDPNYANARYFLALAYVEVGRAEEAVTQLEVVASLNPNNTEVINLINQIQTGSVIETIPAVVEEPIASDNGDSVTSEGDPDSDLLSSVNTVPIEADQSAPDTEAAPTETDASLDEPSLEDAVTPDEAGE